MKISTALKGVSRLGIETAPFIYFVERHPTYLPKVRDIFRQIDQGKFEGVSSMITLVEVLTQPLKMGNSTLEMEYRNILMRSRHFSLLPISVGIAERAAQLRAHYNLKTPDALQVFAAIDAQCDAFLTNDLGLKRVQEINVLLLDELELDSL